MLWEIKTFVKWMGIMYICTFFPPTILYIFLRRSHA